MITSTSSPYNSTRVAIRKHFLIGRSQVVLRKTGHSSGATAQARAKRATAQARAKRATAPLLVPRAQVRAAAIEGTAPSAALCEATAPSARGPARLGGTAGHRRRHCCSRRASAASAGRLRALQVAGRRFWLVREAPEHARTGALSRASAPRPCAAAVRHDFSDFSKPNAAVNVSRRSTGQINPAAPFCPNSSVGGATIWSVRRVQRSRPLFSARPPP
jgi:hypothetical protein